MPAGEPTCIMVETLPLGDVRMAKRLVKSTDKKLFGVAGGVA